MHNEESKNGEGAPDKNIKVFKLKFFKFWQSAEVRAAWR
jgi:hypothetical protein